MTTSGREVADRLARPGLKREHRVGAIGQPPLAARPKPALDVPISEPQVEEGERDELSTTVAGPARDAHQRSLAHDLGRRRLHRSTVTRQSQAQRGREARPAKKLPISAVAW